MPTALSQIIGTYGNEAYYRLYSQWSEFTEVGVADFLCVRDMFFTVNESSIEVFYF